MCSSDLRGNAPVPTFNLPQNVTPKSSLPPEFVVSGRAAAAIFDGNQISGEAAKKIARTCRDWGAARGGAVSIYIFDTHGTLVHQERGDGMTTSPGFPAAPGPPRPAAAPGPGTPGPGAPPLAGAAPRAPPKPPPPPPPTFMNPLRCFAADDKRRCRCILRRSGCCENQCSTKQKCKINPFHRSSSATPIV